jgi:hypothetical protein
MTDFMGIRIIENPYLTEPGEPYEVKRTWRERIFSRPWNPMKTMKTIIPMVPKKEAIQLPDGSLVMHPEMAAELRAQLKMRTLS